MVLSRGGRGLCSIALCVVASGAVFFGAYRWLEADLRRRLIASTSSSREEFRGVASEAMDWPAAWVHDREVVVAIREAARRGFTGAFMLASHLDGDKEEIWRSAYEVMIGRDADEGYDAACLIAGIDKKVPAWLVESIWRHALDVGMQDGKRSRAVIVRAALNGLARNPSGGQHLRSLLAASGADERAALGKIGIVDPEREWR